jgi:hypothetical protein
MDQDRKQRARLWQGMSSATLKRSFKLPNEAAKQHACIEVKGVCFTGQRGSNACPSTWQIPTTAAPPPPTAGHVRRVGAQAIARPVGGAGQRLGHARQAGDGHLGRRGLRPRANTCCENTTCCPHQRPRHVRLQSSPPAPHRTCRPCCSCSHTHDGLQRTWDRHWSQDSWLLNGTEDVQLAMACARGLGGGAGTLLPPPPVDTSPRRWQPVSATSLAGQATCDAPCRAMPPTPVCVCGGVAAWA